MKTVKELLEKYNIIPKTEVPKYVLNHEIFEDEMDSIGEMHTEEHEGRTIYVWTVEGVMSDDMDEMAGKKYKVERILDVNGDSQAFTTISNIGGVEDRDTVWFNDGKIWVGR